MTAPGEPVPPVPKGGSAKTEYAGVAGESARDAANAKAVIAQVASERLFRNAFGMMS